MEFFVFWYFFTLLSLVFTLRMIKSILEEEFEGEIREISNNENWTTSYIREWHHLQPKILRRWVCESFFLYVAQLSHSYPTWDLHSHLTPNNLPLKWEFLLHIDTLPLERKYSQTRVHYSLPLHLYRRSQLYGTRLPEITIRKTFDTGSNCTRPSRKPTALIPLVEKLTL